ncbi:TPR repeat protein [Oxalobacteraceae bacterium GrIS 1.11]
MFPFRLMYRTVLLSSLALAYPGAAAAMDAVAAKTTTAAGFLDQRARLVSKMVLASSANDSDGVLDLRNMIEELPFVERGQRREARKLNTEGLDLLGKQQFPAALERLAAARATDPSDAEISNNLAYAFYRAGRFPEAQQALYQTLALAPARATAWGNLGDLLARMGKEGDAVACYRNAYRFSRAPEKTVAYFQRQQESDSNALVQQALRKALPLLNANGKIVNDADRNATGKALVRTQMSAPALKPEEINIYAIYKLVRNGDKNALQGLRKLGDDGNSLAQYLVGVANRDGLATLADASLAATWLRRAAEQGLPSAQFDLAWMADSGVGAEKNSQEAARLYMQAAEQGYAPAQNNLAVMYARGEAVAQDVVHAFQLFRRAAEQGDAMAQLNLGRYYQAGKGTTADPARAVDWFQKAAEQGLASAQLKLAIAYEYGQGVGKDGAQALLWYKKAAQLGLEPARDALKRLNAQD